MVTYTTIVEALQQAADAIDRREESAQYRIQAYRAAIRAIKQAHSPQTRVTTESIAAIDLTSHMMRKVALVAKVPPPDASMTARATNELRESLLAVQGITQRKAAELMEQGITSITQLKRPPYFRMLSMETQAFLKYNPVRVIPRAWIRELELYIRRTIPEERFHIVGSYRRGRPTSRDVDVMFVVSNTSYAQTINQSSAYLDTVVTALSKQVPMHHYTFGTERLSVMLQIDAIVKSIPSPTYIKVDFFRTSKAEEASNLLYATGSKELNMTMRAKAKAKGWKLNQHGMYDANGKRFPLQSESDYFAKLSMEYLPPTKR